MRLIDADAVAEAVKDEITYAKQISASSQAIMGLKMGLAYINTATTVDAEPVRHGKWIIEDNPRNEWYRVTCPECGENVTSTAPCIGFPPNAKVAWDYCPYCGAKMEGDNERTY